MIRTGMMSWLAGSSTPSDALLADGSFVSQATYADLFALIGHTYNGGTNPGDGTFKLPDADDVILLGKATSGTGSTLGGTGGSATHSHTVTNHTHTVVQPSSHGTHSSEGGHTHNDHTTTNLVVAGGGSPQSTLTGPVTHASGGAHTHDAHSAHTGTATQSAGGATTTTSDPPTLRLRAVVWVRDTFAHPPVGTVVAYVGASAPSNINYFVSPQSDFEGATTGWQSTDFTLVSSTDQAVDGTRSLKATSTVASGSPLTMAETTAFTHHRALVAGQCYIFAGWVRAATTVRSVGLGISWFSDLAGTALISSTVGDPTNNSNSAWGFRFLISECPAGALSFRVNVILWSGAAIGESHYLDAVSYAEADWMLANGASIRRDNLTDLFAEIGTTYGSVDANHFTLPDTQGRYLMGGGTLGATNGSIDHTHAVNDTHTHTITQPSDHANHSTDGGHQHNAHTSANAGTTLAITSCLTSPAGLHASGGAHAHDAHSAHTGAAAAADGTGTTGSANPPSQTFNYLIRASTVAQSQFPVGSVHPFAGASGSTPTEYLYCDATSELRADYPKLFSIQGTAFGAADGTHFTRPDLRGRFPFGKAASGTGSTLGGTFGSIDHTHTGPSHSHAATQPDDHSNHASPNTHPHNGHGSANRQTGVDTFLTGPPSHNAQGAHTHGSHSAHTGFSVNAGGTEATSTANPPFQAVNYMILWRVDVKLDAVVDVVASLDREIDLSREFAVDVDILPTLDRETDLSRSFATTVDIAPTLDTLLALSREFSLAVDVLPTLDRELDLFRSYALAVDVLPTLDRELDLFRGFSIDVDVVPTLDRQTDLARSLDVIVDVEPTLDRTVTASRVFDVIVDVEPTLDRTVSASREFSVAVDVAPSLARTLDLSIELATTVDIAPSFTRALDLNRSLATTVDIVISETHFKIFQRPFSVAVDIVPRTVACLDIELLPAGGTIIVNEEPIYPVFIGD